MQSPKISITPEPGTETILVVEDDESLLRMIERILKHAGYKVLSAKNGGEALFICEDYKDQIQLLITDLIMPQMNGLQLAERLKPMRGSMKILLMSDYTDESITERTTSGLDMPLIEKPFSANALAAKIREVLDAPSVRLSVADIRSIS